MKKKPIPARTQQAQKRKALKELAKVIINSNALLNVPTKEKGRTLSSQVREPSQSKNNPELVTLKPHTCNTFIPDSKGLLQRLAVFSAMLQVKIDSCNDVSFIEDGSSMSLSVHSMEEVEGQQGFFTSSPKVTFFSDLTQMRFEESK